MHSPSDRPIDSGTGNRIAQCREQGGTGPDLDHRKGWGKPLLIVTRRTKRRRGIRARAIGVAVSGLYITGALAGCASSETPPPEVLRVAIFEPQVSNSIDPLIDHIENRLQVGLEIWRADEAEDVVARFERHELDAAYVDAVTAIRAQSRAGIVPLVAPGSGFYTQSYLLARVEESALRLADFRNRPLAFGPERSPASHWMGRAALIRAGFGPDTFFSDLRHTASDADTLAAILAGEVDLGWVDRASYEHLVDDGVFDRNALGLVLVTPPFVSSVWVVSREISQSMTDILEDAFLTFRNTTESSDVHSGLFIPVNSDPDFRILSEVLAHPSGVSD